MRGFHIALFIAMCAASFMQGALNEGRKDLLNQYIAKSLIELSLYELGEIRIKKI